MERNAPSYIKTLVKKPLPQTHYYIIMIVYLCLQGVTAPHVGLCPRGSVAQNTRLDRDS